MFEDGFGGYLEDGWEFAIGSDGAENFTNEAQIGLARNRGRGAEVRRLRALFGTHIESFDQVKGVQEVEWDAYFH